MTARVAIAALALLASGCVGALQGGTVGGATYQWGRVVVTVSGATAGVEVVIDKAVALTNQAGVAEAEVTWKWTKKTPKDERGDYHDVTVTSGGRSRTVRVHPAETVTVRL